MLTFEPSNVTNCEEREISFPLLILSLESKKRHGCETLPLQFFFFCNGLKDKRTLAAHYNGHYSSTFFPKSGSTLMNAVTAKVIAQRNITRMKKEL